MKCRCLHTLAHLSGRHTSGDCDGLEGPAPRPADAAVNGAVASEETRQPGRKAVPRALSIPVVSGSLRAVLTRAGVSPTSFLKRLASQASVRTLVTQSALCRLHL